MSTAGLLLDAAGGVGVLLVLVMRLRLQPFVALLVVSLLVGLGAGMASERVIASMTAGLGSTLGAVAVVVGLGSMFGHMLEISGGARRLAERLIEVLGRRSAALGLAVAGFLVAVPTMFEVGFIVLVPLALALSQQGKRPQLEFAIPLLTGLAVGHAFMPPTAAPVAVAAIVKADLGRVILLGALCGVPVTLLLGPWCGRWMGRRVERVAELPEPEHVDATDAPSFGLVLGPVVLPIALIVARMVVHTPVFDLLGTPLVALLLTTLASFYLLGIRRGLSARKVQAEANRSLGAAASILLVIGGGGAFKQVLVDSGIGAALAAGLAPLPVSPLILCFLMSAVVRVSQGSATVAMMTAAGLMSDVPGDPAQKVIALAAGATVLSHVNDAGFWLVKEYLGMSEGETLRSWTVLTTLIGLLSLLFLLLWSALGI